ANGRIAMRMKLHRVAYDVCHLGESPVVGTVQRPKDASLHRLQTISECWNGAIANDVRGVFEKVDADAAMQRELNIPRHERTMHGRLDLLCQHVGFALAIAIFSSRALAFGGLR